jgi:hypothetical protein
VQDSYVTSFRVGLDGIRFRTPPKGRGRLQWDEVAGVSWSAPMKWFAIRTREGHTVRLPALLFGLPALAQALLTNVPRSCFEDDARHELSRRATERTPKE